MVNSQVPFCAQNCGPGPVCRT